MTDFYLDVSAVGNEYQTYADIPTTWGVPQDGNGKAGPGHSAAVAIAVIDCTSAVGDGSQTLSILGITVSNTSTGSGATLAASLVTSINSTATATTATYCQALLPLNKLIFARQKPDELAKVQVMMRIAGADWNGIAPTHAGFTTGPTITAFAGGANGPFGYWLPSTSIFGKAAGVYGIFGSLPAGVTKLSSSDRIIMRSARSGVALGITITISNLDLLLSQQNHYLYIDNLGKYWTGNRGVVVITTNFTLTTGSARFYRTDGSTSGTVTIEAGIKEGIVFNFTFPNSTPDFCFFRNYLYQLILINIKLEVLTTNTVSIGYEGNTNTDLTMIGCYMIFRQSIYFISGGTVKANIVGTDCTFKWVGAGTNIQYATGSTLAAGGITIIFTNCDFIVDDGAYYISNLCQNNGNANFGNGILVLDGCSGFNTPSMPFDVTVPGESYFYYRDIKSGDFRYDTSQFSIDCIASANYPKLSAVTPSGINTTMRLSLNGAKFNFRRRLTPVKLSSVNRAGDSIRNVGVELLIPTILTLIRAYIFLAVSYVDENNVYRRESTTPTSLSDTTAEVADGIGLGAWTLNGVTGVQSKWLGLTTAYKVKSGTEISAVVGLNQPPPGSYSVYINPELL